MGTEHGAEQWEAAAPRRLGRAVLLAALLVAVAATALAVRGPGGADGEPLAVETSPGVGDPTAEPVADGGAWRDLPPAPVAARRGHVLAWTGACPAGAAPPRCGEVLAWGGHAGAGPLADGAAYDPERDTWRVMADAPRGGGAAGVWTGVRTERPWAAAGGGAAPSGELIVWGATAADELDGDERAGASGGAGARVGEPRGVAYDPVRDAWRVLPEAPIEPRKGHTLTWTGREVVVWGGRVAGSDGPAGYRADGAAYDPAADAWRPVAGAPIEPRASHAAAAGPRRTALVFGGFDAAGQALADGAVYDPSGDAWTVVDPPPLAVVARRSAFVPALAWLPADGSERVYAVAPFRQRSRGDPLVGAYRVGERTWDARQAGPLGLRSGALAAATPAGGLLVWGGRAARGGALTDGAHLVEGAWSPLPPGPARLADGAAVWTGADLIVWGGLGSATGEGARLAVPAGERRH